MSVPYADVRLVPEQTLQPTELQPRVADECSSSIALEMREHLNELARQDPREPAYAVHLELAFLKLASRLDAIERRLR